MEEHTYIVKGRFIDIDGSMKLPGEHIKTSIARAVLLRNNGKIGGIVETAVVNHGQTPESAKNIPENAMSKTAERRGKRR